MDRSFPPRCYHSGRIRVDVHGATARVHVFSHSGATLQASWLVRTSDVMLADPAGLLGPAFEDAHADAATVLAELRSSERRRFALSEAG